jgi:tetratricopeptide (TPR) repeat protein
MPAGVAKEEGLDGSVDLVNFSPTRVVERDGAGRHAGGAAPIQRRIGRWIKPGMRPWISVVAALAFVCVVIYLGPRLYRSFKAWRATQLALQGEELIKTNQIEEAIPTVRSAFLLSPNAPEVVRAMAHMLSAFDSPDAMTYWHWLLESDCVTDDDRRAAVECAMRNGLYDEASIIIKDLLARRGGDARNELLAARWSTQRGTPEETMHFATRAVNDDPTSKPAILFLAVQELANPYLHQDAINSLFQLAGSDDAFGLMALHCLALDPSLKPAEIDRLIARLHSHPLAGEPERLDSLIYEIKRHPIQRETLLEQAMASHQKASPADLASFAEWLNATGEAARVLKFITRDMALSNKNIFTAYIDALVTLKHWAELKALLSGASVPLEVPFVELYLSRASSEMGDIQGSNIHWQNAVSAAESNPVQSLLIAKYAEKLGQNERAATVYRALTREPVTARLAYLGLLRVLSNKDIRTLRDLVEQMVVRWPKDEGMGTQYVFYNLLLNERVQEMHGRAIHILNDDPNSISHHTNVALACLRLNDPAGAMTAYSRISVDWNTTPIPDLVVYAATLDANGRTEAAHRLLRSVHRHDLRPELRDLIKSIP